MMEGTLHFLAIKGTQLYKVELSLEDPTVIFI
jgi:hypothetical protein